jgi:hypothetical protein
MKHHMTDAYINYEMHPLNETNEWINEHEMNDVLHDNKHDVFTKVYTTK